MRRPGFSRRTWTAGAACLGGGALVTACAAIAGIDSPKERISPDAGVNAQPDGATVDATSETSDANGTNDGGPQPVADGGCPGSPDDTMGVYVDGTAGHDTVDCGTRAAACATIAAAELRAQALSKPLVYVAAGMYFGPVTLVAGVTLQGGWVAQGSLWSAACASQMVSAVTIQGTAAGSATILAQGLGGTAGLDTLTVLSAPTSDLPANATAYGVIATGASTHLTLNNVVIQTATGAAGAAGADVGDAAPPLPVVPDGGCTSSTGASGGIGEAGAPAAVSFFTAAGYVWLDGGSGLQGGTGANGTPGTLGNCAGSSCTSAFDGTTIPSPACAATGAGGCGGIGGSGGGTGSGGGSSVPLFVSGATVTATGGLLRAGNGGAGGAGGAGGPGGSGAPGTPGAIIACFEGYHTCGPSAMCPTIVVFDGGSPGGVGGAGGTGGVGSGGPGGWSCAVAAVADASVDLSGTRLLVGEGGAGGAPNGAGGTAQERCP